jgi:hypothetical protein
MMGGRENPRKLGEKCVQSHFIHHESQMKSAEIEPKAMQ